jgi:hypothetical protein
MSEDYPYRVLDGDPGWYASLGSEGDDPDWFSLELGIQVGADRVNLVPALLDLLDTCPDMRSLDRLCNRSPCIALRAGDGRYATIPAVKLRRLLGVLRELYQGGGVAEAAPVPTERSRLPLPRPGAIRLPALDSILGRADGGLAWEGHA